MKLTQNYAKILFVSIFFNHYQFHVYPLKDLSFQESQKEEQTDSKVMTKAGILSVIRLIRFY